MTKSTPKGPLVCVLAYDGLCTFEFGICAEVFGLDRPELNVPWYRFAVIADTDAPLNAAGGISVTASHGLDYAKDADLILIPGWRGADSPVPTPITDMLKRAVADGARVASICSGVFVLAAAGLLAGKRATTHWRYSERLKQTDPTITVEPDVLYIDEGNILTSAGSAAGLDLCLHIVRTDFGVEIANTVARRLVLPAHRDGGQAQYIPRPLGRERGGQIGPLLDTISRQVNENWSVERMAARAGMTPRTLLRRFKETTGSSPQAWLTQQRIAFTCEFLETSDQPIGIIAERVGFGSPETLRHHFRRQLKVSPQVYRSSFQA
jgi:AraC family transcriptional activator FtrA